MKKEKYIKPEYNLVEIEPIFCLAESKDIYSDGNLYIDDGNADVKGLDIQIDPIIWPGNDLLK